MLLFLYRKLLNLPLHGRLFILREEFFYLPSPCVTEFNIIRNGTINITVTTDNLTLVNSRTLSWSSNIIILQAVTVCCDRYLTNYSIEPLVCNLFYLHMIDRFCLFRGILIYGYFCFLCGFQCPQNKFLTIFMFCILAFFPLRLNLCFCLLRIVLSWGVYIYCN